MIPWEAPQRKISLGRRVHQVTRTWAQSLSPPQFTNYVVLLRFPKPFALKFGSYEDEDNLPKYVPNFGSMAYLSGKSSGGGLNMEQREGSWREKCALSWWGSHLWLHLTFHVLYEQHAGPAQLLQPHIRESVYSSFHCGCCAVTSWKREAAKAQDCWVHQKFGVVLFFEVPADLSWRDLVFHL